MTSITSFPSDKDALYARLIRGGCPNLATEDFDTICIVLSAAKTRDSLLDAADAVVELLAGDRVDKNLVLEAVAAFRGMRSWDALSAAMPISKRPDKRDERATPQHSYPADLGPGVFRCPTKFASGRDLAQYLTSICEPHSDAKKTTYDKDAKNGAESPGHNWQCGDRNDFFLNRIHDDVWQFHARYLTSDERNQVRNVLVRMLRLEDVQVFNGVPATADAAEALTRQRSVA